MNCEYDAKVVKYKKDKMEGGGSAHSGVIWLEVVPQGKKMKVLAFVILEYVEKFTEGKNAKVKFSIIDFDSRKVTERKKSFTQIEKGTNVTTMVGEIVELKQHQEIKECDSVLIDCGIIVRAKLYKRDSMKVGDFVRVEGRLDAGAVK